MAILNLSLKATGTFHVACAGYTFLTRKLWGSQQLGRAQEALPKGQARFPPPFPGALARVLLHPGSPAAGSGVDEVTTGTPGSSALPFPAFCRPGDGAESVLIVFASDTSPGGLASTPWVVQTQGTVSS